MCAASLSVKFGCLVTLGQQRLFPLLDLLGSFVCETFGEKSQKVMFNLIDKVHNGVCRMGNDCHKSATSNWFNNNLKGSIKSQLEVEKVEKEK